MGLLWTKALGGNYNFYADTGFQNGILLRGKPYSSGYNPAITYGSSPNYNNLTVQLYDSYGFTYIGLPNLIQISGSLQLNGTLIRYSPGDDFNGEYSIGLPSHCVLPGTVGSGSFPFLSATLDTQTTYDTTKLRLDTFIDKAIGNKIRFTWTAVPLNTFVTLTNQLFFFSITIPVTFL